MAWNIQRTTQQQARVIGDKGLLAGIITTDEKNGQPFRTELLSRFDISHGTFNEACAFVRGVESTMRAFKIYKDQVINGPEA